MAFYLQSLHSRLYVQVKGSEEHVGASVTVGHYHGKKSQQWKYVNGKIESKLNNFVLDVTGGENIILAERNDSANQNWTFAEDFTIENGRGLVLDIRRASKEPGTDVLAYKKHGGKNQQFRVVPVNKTN